jgi:hypothetical protein
MAFEFEIEKLADPLAWVQRQLCFLLGPRLGLRYALLTNSSSPPCSPPQMYIICLLFVLFLRMPRTVLIRIYPRAVCFR